MSILRWTRGLRSGHQLGESAAATDYKTDRPLYSRTTFPELMPFKALRVSTISLAWSAILR